MAVARSCGTSLEGTTRRLRCARATPTCSARSTSRTTMTRRTTLCCAFTVLPGTRATLRADSRTIVATSPRESLLDRARRARRSVVPGRVLAARQVAAVTYVYAICSWLTVAVVVAPLAGRLLDNTSKRYPPVKQDPAASSSEATAGSQHEGV